MNKDSTNYQEHLEQWAASGLSKAGYCKAENISYQTFMYHSGRMHKKQQKGNGFVQINTPDQITSGIEYHYKNGNYFIFPVHCSVQMIKSLISECFR